MRQDLPLALRLFRRHPRFAWLAVLVLTLGIGANAALFGVIDGVFLSPLSLHEPERLVHFERAREDGSTDGHFTDVEYRTLRDHGRSFEAITAVWDARPQTVFVISGISEAERVNGARVSPNFFQVLGVRVALGRAFDGGLERGDGDRAVAVLSHYLWQTVFQGDSSIVGRTIDLNQRPHVVLGVLAGDVDLPGPQGAVQPGSEIGLWTPLPTRVDNPGRLNYDRMIARLRPGVTLPAAEQEATLMLDAGGDRSRAGVPRLTRLRDRLVGESRVALFLLFAALALILVLTCVNLAGLQLARTLTRRPEIGIRAALGASASRLARQYLMEGAVIAVVGGAFGFVAAVWIQRLMIAWAPRTLPRPEAAHLGLSVLWFTIGAILVAAVVSSLTPMLEAARGDAVRGLKSGRHHTVGRRGRRVRGAVASLQVALAVILLSGSTLLVQSLWRLQTTDLGFDPGRIVAIDLYRETIGNPSTAAAFYSEVLDRVRELPQVQTATLASSVPARHRDYYGPAWRTRVVGDDFFELLGTPIREGRAFSREDRGGGPPVGIVNETLARQESGDVSPVGRMFDDLLITGVAADVRHVRADQPALPALYVPYWQRRDTRLTLLVDSGLQPPAFAKALGPMIHELNPRQPVGEAVPLAQALAQSPAMAERRFFVRLLGALSLIALTLALMGAYGVIAQLVADGTREFGVRIALGASSAGIGRLVLRRAGGIVAGGIIVGLVTARGLGSLLQSLLYEVGPADPGGAALVAACVAATTFAVAWFPARRATRVSPTIAIKAE